MNKLTQILNRLSPRASFKIITFGCRVNAAESNQLGQLLIDNGFTRARPNQHTNDLFIINTCAVTQKGEYESTAKIRHLLKLHPLSFVVVTGCAAASLKLVHPNLFALTNGEKELLLEALNGSYSPKIADKYTSYRRFLLKVQSGCSSNCSYCVVPVRRPSLKSLPIDMAVKTVNKAVQDGYREIIITGVNLAQYTPGLSNLLEALLTKTQIPLISFGSLPLLCIDKRFIQLITVHGSRFTKFLHVPLQSGSNRILKLMRRPYTHSQILTIFNKLKNINAPPFLKGEDRGGFKFGTDIIVGFPSESEEDFQQTYDLCKSLSFAKIHIFRFSPRPSTKAWDLNQKFPVRPQDINTRSRLLHSISKLD